MVGDGVRRWIDGGVAGLGACMVEPPVAEQVGARMAVRGLSKDGGLWRGPKRRRDAALRRVWRRALVGLWIGAVNVVGNVLVRAECGGVVVRGGLRRRR